MKCSDGYVCLLCRIPCEMQTSTYNVTWTLATVRVLIQQLGGGAKQVQRPAIVLTRRATLCKNQCTAIQDWLAASQPSLPGKLACLSGCRALPP